LAFKRSYKIEGEFYLYYLVTRLFFINNNGSMQGTGGTRKGREREESMESQQAHNSEQTSRGKLASNKLDRRPKQAGSNDVHNTSLKPLTF